ncbi:YciI family protein [Paludibaculum fermentans]|uniref:YciI family protein n=1 Tax=Paludibaculum fermentans TaxID=1473598 RepID=A0A7S7SJR4_PALFE|nr:YciI family protein [Paludibaculum fermentans]QOY86706.1 YciI family protein [Paludibaculum fermentans]
MKFLCIVFVDEARLHALSPRESQALDDVSLAYDETLRERGHLLAAQALESVNTAAVVRVRDGRVLVTDGPFAEAREQVGGFILIEARDRGEAIEVAARIPAIQLGGIEVRPVKELVASSSLHEKPQ